MKKSTATVTIVLGLLGCIHVGLFATVEESKIVNGEKAKLGEFPSLVCLEKNNKEQCGASIINKNYIVTAAHCVKEVPVQNFSVLAGTINLKDLKGASVHKVSSYKVHEKYNAGDSWINDIALVNVDPPFDFNSNIAAVTLASKGQVLKDNDQATVAGFGDTDSKRTLSSILLKTTVFILNNKDCQKKYDDETVHSTNICTVNTKTSTGYCNGDSGGPVMSGGKLVGIISFSVNNGCQFEKYPQVSTRVSDYIDWIGTNIK